MSLKIFTSGDVLNQKGKQDFISESVKEFILAADFSICNFEAPIFTEESKPINKIGPHLSQSRNSVKCLKDSGFTHASLANNHIYDYGQSGLIKTIEEFKKNNIEYVGAGRNFNDAYAHLVLEKNNLKIALIAACENEFGCIYEDQDKGGYAWLFHDQLEDKIRELKKEVNYVVLMAHAGIENINIPIKEWRDRYKRLCKLGVDIVVGHHPHVPQGYEEYESSLIFYSLGNFYFDAENIEIQNNHNESFSVLFDFNESNFSYNLIFHKKVNNQVRVIDEDEASFKIDYLNKLLLDDYEMLNNSISIELYEKHYNQYYKSAMGLANSKDTLMNKFKSFVLRNIFENKWKHKRNLLLLHNIRIDSHRFVAQRALSLMSEESKDIKDK